MGSGKYWTLFTMITAFSIYWMVNLILWFPWSFNTTLGMTLMLTLSPVIWAMGMYDCLKRFQGKKIMKGAALTALIYICIAVIADFIFFGIIRNAMKELYHPTTLYGYLFLVALPFILILILPGRLTAKEQIKRRDFLLYIIPGVASIVLLSLIIKLNISI